MQEIKDKLVSLYQAMYELTRPECDKCRVPRSCCSPEYCTLTVDYAKEKWGVELPLTTHPKLPLMGSSGCTAAPHLRPFCTLHTCEINGCGFKRNDPVWTEKYFNLREEIEVLEYELDNKNKIRGKHDC